MWGVAYKIKEQDIEEVTEHLDFREKNGYSKKSVLFHPKENMKPFELTLYVASEENESYAGKLVYLFCGFLTLNCDPGEPCFLL